jgi:acetolactate synthase-1/2/3 large subunit
MEQATTTNSDLIVAYLERIGIEVVFGIPGGHIASLYEALHRAEPRGGPRPIMNRHETGAAFMAAGYTLESKKIGVCFVTAGPGATNIVTGAAEAHACHIPMLIISGQTVLPPAGRGALQECGPHHGPYPDIIDTVGMLEHCTCYNALVTHPKQLEYKLAAALIAAHQPLGGPAHLAIPADILRAPGPEGPAFPNLPTLIDNAQAESFIDDHGMNQLQELVCGTLEGCGRIALFIGYECGEARDEIMAFAEAVDAPIVTSLRGKAHINPFHPLFKGVYGVGGHRSARAALEDESIQLILAVGSSLGQMGSGIWNANLLNEKLVHIHHANTYFLRSPMARLQVRGTPSRIFERLNQGLKGRASKTAHALHADADFPPQLEIRSPQLATDDATPIKPPRVMVELKRRLPSDTRYLVDNGTAVEWSLHYLLPRSAGAYRLISTSPCSMGWAPGGAVGTAMANPGIPVVCLVGDASFLMYGHEISVAVRERLPLLFVILNDDCYGAVKHRNRQIGNIDLPFDLPPTDFVTMAESVGARGFRVESPGDLAALDLPAFVKHPGPTVLDVRIDPEEAPPMGE